MSSATTANQTSAGPKRHSPVFLGVFAVFLVGSVICAVGTVIGVVQAVPSHHDTQWFWASGHLLAQGKNPYDRPALREIETSLGLPGTASVPMTLNPPWTVFLLVPLGMLGPRAGVVVWSLSLVVLLAISIKVLTGIPEMHPERAYLWLAWLFAPALCCIEMGQTGLIVLLGVALFLRFHESRPFWAGVALSLCATKPHLLLPFGLVLLVWVALRWRWAILSGAVMALGVESAIAMLFDRAIWTQYRAMMGTEKFVNEFIPTLGVAFRYLLDQKAMWIEFLPAAAGCVWGLWYFWQNRERWDWKTHGSLLTLVSLVAAPYSWFTDQVIALPAILFALASREKLRRGSLTLLLAVMSAGAVEMLVSRSLFYKPFLWQGVAWLAWYLYATSGKELANAEPAVS